MLSILNQPEKLCQTMAQALNKLHSLKQQSFPSENHLKRYKEKALKNYQKGTFYNKTLLPQFHIHSREEAYQLIQEKVTFSKANAFIHGDACLPFTS